MYLAATPAMFENAEYFPRYDALATRIQAIGPEVNWRAPVIDLDRTPLQPGELRRVGVKIRAVHGAAYADGPALSLGDDVIAKFVDEVMKSRFRVGKPRLLARSLVDELERARQSGEQYIPPVEPGQTVQQVAEKIMKEASA